MNQDVTLSFALIVRDEERCIIRCLNSILKQCDDIVIVDTGSKDRTVPLIESLKEDKIRVYSLEWQDNFSDAKNYALEKCSGDWVFFIDADEWIADRNTSVKKIISSEADSENYINLALCPTIKHVNSPFMDNKDIIRVVKNGSGFRFVGSVHEQLFMEGIFKRKIIDLTLNHDGYSAEIINKKEKIKRNVDILAKLLTDDKGSSREAYFFIKNCFVGGVPFEVVYNFFVQYNFENQVYYKFESAKVLLHLLLEQEALINNIKEAMVIAITLMETSHENKDGHCFYSYKKLYKLLEKIESGEDISGYLMSIRRGSGNEADNIFEYYFNGVEKAIFSN